MDRRRLVILALSLVVAQPIAASADSAPAPAASGGHAYDPCEMASQADVASAAGVATQQVYTPKSPTKNECIWTIGNKTGDRGKTIALTLQTVDQVKGQHGMARLKTLFGAVQQVPGFKMPTNPLVTRAFADTQVVMNLGDQAGWNPKTAALSVLKNETLYQVNITGQPNDDEAKKTAIAVAKIAITNTPVPTPSP